MHRHLRYGYTTGACAAAAARGAALMLREQAVVNEVEINLPTGETARFRLHGQQLLPDRACCYVIKDGGDDPDVTNGAQVHCTVKVDFFTGNRFVIEAGDGIGRVTKPGLAVAVGEAAINPVPRRMMLEAVKEVFAMRCMPAAFTIIPSIPDGAERAKKTLNGRLGIVGGLSLLGTTGIVRPVSADAWTATIDTAIDVALACGSETVVLSTGRSSELVAQRLFGTRDSGLGTRNPEPATRNSKLGTRNSELETRDPLPEEAFVMMGDHVGHALRACSEKGVRHVVIAGQFAKLLKIACGHGQTHVASSEVDLSMLAGWCAAVDPRSPVPAFCRSANTARQVLAASGNDPALIKEVCARVLRFAETVAPGPDVKVLLAGYGGEVLYCGCG